MATTQNSGGYTTNVYSGNNAVNFQFVTDEAMATDTQMAALVAAIKALPWPVGFGAVTVQAYKQATTTVVTNFDSTTNPPSYD